MMISDYPPLANLARLTRLASAATLAKARALLGEAPLPATFVLQASGQMRANLEFPVRNRSPFDVSVTWDGRSLKTRCTCPTRRTVTCVHKLYLAMRLNLHLKSLHKSDVLQATQRGALPSPPGPNPDSLKPIGENQARMTDTPASPPARSRRRKTTKPDHGASPSPGASSAASEAVPEATPEATPEPAHEPEREPSEEASTETGSSKGHLRLVSSRSRHFLVAAPTPAGEPKQSGPPLDVYVDLLAVNRLEDKLLTATLYVMEETGRRLIAVRPEDLRREGQYLTEKSSRLVEMLPSSGPRVQGALIFLTEEEQFNLVQALAELKVEPHPSSALKVADTFLSVSVSIPDERQTPRPAIRLVNRSQDKPFRGAVLLGQGPSSVALVGDTLYRLRKPFVPSIFRKFRVTVTAENRQRIGDELVQLGLVGDKDLLPGARPQSVETLYVSEQSPQGLLSLTEVDGVLTATLFFRYGEDAPPTPASDVASSTVQFANGRKFVVVRDRYLESQLEWRLHRSFLTRAPKGTFTATGDNLLAFVHESIPQLEAEGWKIEGAEALPSRLNPPLPVLPEVKISRHIHWFRFDVTLRSEAGPIPLAAVMKAWREGKRFVHAGERQAVRLPTEWLEKTGDLLDALATAATPLEGGFQIPTCLAPMAGAVAEQSPGALLDPDFQAFHSRLLALTQEERVALPSGLEGTLRPYQKVGFDWLLRLNAAGVGGILADDMGLGKTVQVLTLLLHESLLERGRRSLVVVPTSVLENWAREAARFTPSLKTCIFHGSGRFTGTDLELADLVITSYALIRRDLAFHREQAYHYLILDEAQAIKNPESDTARACRQLKATHRLALSGTPMENRLLELWSLFAFLMPELLGSQMQFSLRYEIPIGQHMDRARQAELRRRVTPFILRRLKEDVAPDLPSLTEDTLFCDLSPDQAELYRSTVQAFRQRILTEVERVGLERSRMTIFDALLRLRLICCHPPISGVLPVGKDVGSAKKELFKETLLEVLGGGHRVLVYSQFVKMLHVLRDDLTKANIPFLYLDGATRDRQARVDRFNQGEAPVFLISLKAGGTGLNLVGADYVIHYDPWWNPAVENQATDRAHRIGQTKPVFAYRLITRGTVEEKMLELHARKRSLVEGLLASDERMGRLLTRDDLEYLFPTLEMN